MSLVVRDIDRIIQPGLWCPTQQPRGPVQVNQFNPLAAGLAGAWSFHHPSRRAIDLSGYGNHFARNPNNTYPSWQGGPEGVELKFDGSDDYMATAGVANANLSGPITVFVRARPGSLSARRLLFFATSSGGWAIAQNGDSGSYLHFMVGTATSMASSTAKRLRAGITAGVAYNFTGVASVWEDGNVVRAVLDENEITDTGGGTWTAASSSGTLNMGRRPTTSYYDGSMLLAYIWNRELSLAEIKQLHAAPYAILQNVAPRRVWVPVAAGGPYTENLTSVITSVVSATDRQDYVEAVSSLIQSQASADSIQAMLESLVTLAQSTSTVADVQQMVEQALTTIQSTATVTDAVAMVEDLVTTITSTATASDVQAYAETLLTTAQSAATVADVAQMVEGLLTTITSSASVVDTLTSGFSETLLTTAISVSQVNEAQAYVDALASVIQSAASVAEVQGFMESLGTTVQTITAVSEQQLFVENVAIIALSGASLTEIMHYIDQVQVTAMSQASVVDVLVEAFVGKYIFQDFARPRLFSDTAGPRMFADIARPRRFADTVRPRGAA